MTDVDSYSRTHSENNPALSDPYPQMWSNYSSDVILASLGGCPGPPRHTPHRLFSQPGHYEQRFDDHDDHEDDNNDDHEDDNNDDHEDDNNETSQNSKGNYVLEAFSDFECVHCSLGSTPHFFPVCKQIK